MYSTFPHKKIPSLPDKKITERNQKEMNKDKNERKKENEK